LTGDVIGFTQDRSHPPKAAIEQDILSFAAAQDATLGGEIALDGDTC
jgi:hypothetical protein